MTILGISGSRYYRLKTVQEQINISENPNLSDKYNFNSDNLDIDQIFIPENLDLIFKPEFMKNINRVIHGGAIGFDQTFDSFLREKYPEIEIEVIKPNYLKGINEECKKHNKIAPILRNKKIVEKSDIIVTLSSHNSSHGTQSVVDFALELNKPVESYLYDFINKDYIRII